MKNIIDDILKVDTLSLVEQKTNKHWSKFDNNEMLMALSLNMANNSLKENILKQNNDTYFSMKWQEFISIIENNGFYCAYKGEVKREDCLDEEVIYYNENGFVLYASSFGRKSVNGGTLYGQCTYEKKDQEYLWNVMNGCSHGHFDTKDENNLKMEFSYDVREGLINKVKSIKSFAKPITIWEKKSFVWFLNGEENSDNYENINIKKINKSCQKLKDILNIHINN